MTVSGRSEQAPPCINYRRLLWKYMEHVGAEEGITFVSNATTGPHEDDFTEEEIIELNTINDMEGEYVED